jgi:hypothetical protein
VTGRAHPTGSRRLALLVGASMAVFYLAGAVVSGHLSVPARRPMLDGLAPPPPYAWVSPPPSLAATNTKPVAGRFAIDLDPSVGSTASVYSTADAQVSLGLPDGGIPPIAGETSAILTITPLAPGTFRASATGETLWGNVYRVQATYRPTRQAITSLGQTAQLVLFYPAPPNLLGYKHTVLHSSDGKTWTALASIDAPAQQQVQADARELGYFVVGQQKIAGASAKSFPLGRIVTFSIVGLLAIVVVGVFIRAEVRERRARRRRP